MTDSPTYVLVHGAWEDAGVWDRVIEALSARGLRAVAVNLPGRGPSAEPAASITLDTLRDAVLRVVEAEPAPVILVGHSFGGMTISAVAEAAPHKVRQLIYVAAYLPTDGQSLQDLAFSDADSKAGPEFVIDEAAMVARIRPEARADLFLNDAGPELRAGFSDTMVDEPLRPLGAPVALTPERFGQAPRAYIYTERDLVVSPQLQRRMTAATPVQSEGGVDTGHAPFLTRPEQLADIIVAVSKS